VATSVGRHTVRAIKATQKHVAQVSACPVINSSIAFRFAAVLIRIPPRAVKTLR
jgi:hypothetical protein